MRKAQPAAGAQQDQLGLQRQYPGEMAGIEIIKSSHRPRRDTVCGHDQAAMVAHLVDLDIIRAGSGKQIGAAGIGFVKFHAVILA